jgi:F0F1-type ATP synthase assembly protein I
MSYMNVNFKTEQKLPSNCWYIFKIWEFCAVRFFSETNEFFSSTETFKILDQLFLLSQIVCMIKLCILQAFVLYFCY